LKKETVRDLDGTKQTCQQLVKELGEKVTQVPVIVPRSGVQLLQAIIKIG
jgi:hypothetical protein